MFFKVRNGDLLLFFPLPTVRQLILLSFIHFLPLIRILKHDKYLKNTWVYFWTLYVTSNKYSVALFLTVELIKCLISVLSNTISVYYGKNIAQSLSSKTLYVGRGNNEMV